MRNMLRYGPSAVTTISGLTVLVSILHEWAYYTYIEIDLFGIMSMGDFATTALQWLPATLLMFFAGVASGLFFTRVEGGRSEEELAAQSAYPRFIYWFRRSADALVPIFVMLAGIVGFSFLPGEPVWPMGWPVAIVWVIFASWFLKNEKINKKFTAFSAKAFVFVPAIAVIILVEGASSAHKDLQSSAGDFSITVKNHGTSDDVQILRTLSSGLLIRNSFHERIAFLPWSEVTEVVRENIQLKKPPRICRWFEGLCSPSESKDRRTLKSGKIK